MERIYIILRGIRPEFDFSQSSNFIEDGLLDSFDIITLIAQLDEEFNVSIDGMDIIPENIQSVESIAGLIRKNGGEI